MDNMQVPALDKPIADEPARTPFVKPQAQRMYGADGKMTREAMINAIRNGQSVSYNGKHIWRAQDLPTAMELAGDNEEAKAKAKADVEKQIAALQASLTPKSGEKVSTHQSGEKRALEGHTVAPGASGGAVQTAKAKLQDEAAAIAASKAAREAKEGK